MHPNTEKSLEEIDASLYSGFVDLQDLVKFHSYIDRWGNKLKEWKDFHDEVTEHLKKLFGKHGMMGFWKEKYSSIGAPAIIADLKKRDAPPSPLFNDLRYL